jgi:hypothetical protein
MKLTAMLVAMTVALMHGPAVALPTCEVPDSLIATDKDLVRVMSEIKHNHRLAITVVGTGSSTLPGPDGARFAYPARLQQALRQGLPGKEITVVTHIRQRETAAEMVAALGQILADDKPALVIWQAGTYDAVNGIDPDAFSASLQAGVQAIAATGADVILLDMQYSPRTDSMLNVSAYADVMHWVAQSHGTPLFDRLAIMRYWNEQGTFDLYAATKNSDMARRVHDCIGMALAAQIMHAAHLKRRGGEPKDQ